MRGTVQEPIFEALNFQFRGPGPDGVATSVGAVALTQKTGGSPQPVPEPTLLLGLVSVLGLGFRRK